MANKNRLLFLMKYLQQHSDDEHPLTTADLTKALHRQGYDIKLSTLKNDIDTHYISDSLAAVYLADEAAVADTLHNRILYFQDRLSNQDKALKTLRKTISKVASK